MPNATLTDPLVLCIALPLLGAMLVTALPRWAVPLGVLAALATTAAAMALGAAVWQQGGLRLVLGGWDGALAITLRADGLATAMVLMANGVALGISVYAAGHFRDPAQVRSYWPLWLLLWTGLNGVFLSGDLFNLYLLLGLVGINAAALGALTGHRHAVAANLRFLLLWLLGGMSYLLGVALLYTAHGTLDMGLLAEAIAATPDRHVVSTAAMTLMTAGLAIKAALFPMHFWLPPAHANAPAPVSGARSALVVKASFYVILRLWLDVFWPITDQAVATVPAVLGAGAVAWGSWRALRAERLKLLAAYSTVAQIGYLFLFLPLLAATPVGPARDDLLAALVLMALTHGFAKSALFLAAGLVQTNAGHDRIEELGGTAQRLPATTFTIALAGAALIGLPPSGSFIGKWLFLQAAIATGQWWLVIVIGVGTLLAAAYVFRVLSRAFSLEPTPLRFITDVRTEVPAFTLALIAMVLLSPLAGPLWTLLGLGTTGYGG